MMRLAVGRNRGDVDALERAVDGERGDDVGALAVDRRAEIRTDGDGAEVVGATAKVVTPAQAAGAAGPGRTIGVAPGAVRHADDAAGRQPLADLQEVADQRSIDARRLPFRVVMLRAVCSARMALVIAVNVPPSTTSMMPIDDHHFGQREARVAAGRRE